MSDSEVAEKKPRGRPKKSDAEKAVSPAAKKPKAAESSDTPVRSRGRPKGSLNKKRKKKKVMPKKSTTPLSGKKRGRKPKAAKPASEGEEEEDEDEAAEEGEE